MSETVIVMHIINGYMHRNNFLNELVSHTLGSLFPIPYVQSKITTSGNTTCHLTAQCLYTGVLLQRGYHRDTTFCYRTKGIA